MRGKIVRKHGDWVIVGKPEDYRKLELVVLKKFLGNSSYMDSNKALEHESKILIDNFRKESENTALFRFEKWRNTIDDIIRLRTEAIEYHRKDSESEKEKKIRRNHENRRDYWIPIREEIHYLVNYQSINARKKPEIVQTSQITSADYKPWDIDIARYLSYIEYKEVENEMFCEQKEIERAKAASVKQYDEEQSALLAETILVEQIARDRRRNEIARQSGKTPKI